MARSKGLTFYKRRKKINPIIFREFFNWLLGVAIAVFLAFFLNYFLGISTNVVGVSMEPTLYNSQKIYVNRFIYILSRPKEGDIVVFLPNGNKNSHYYVKRVVAVPGDTVHIQNGILYVNGEPSSHVKVKIVDAGIGENEFVLGNGEYFCIGDNPNNSEDSRSANIGPVNEKDILGKAWFRLKHEELGMGFVR